MNMKKFCLILALFLLLSGCGKKDNIIQDTQPGTNATVST